MATHSSVPACRIPGTGEPGGLPSAGSHRVGHDWSDSAAAANLTYLHSFHPFFQQELLGVWSVPRAVPPGSGKPADVVSAHLKRTVGWATLE